MPAFTITIPGQARGKQRARVTTRGGKARAYTPQQTVGAEAWVKHCCISQVGSPRLEGPLSVEIAITVEVPASWSKKKRGEALAGRILPTGKIDLDNGCKLVCDALNGILWRDDSQIVDLTARKRYGEVSQTVVSVTKTAYPGASNEAEVLPEAPFEEVYTSSTRVAHAS